MEKFIVTVKNQFETINIKGVEEKALYRIIKAYLEKIPEFKLGGKTYFFKEIYEFYIHKFDNENVLDSFLKYINKNGLFKKSITGREYFEIQQIEQYGEDVSDKYLKF